MRVPVADGCARLNRTQLGAHARRGRRSTGRDGRRASSSPRAAVPVGTDPIRRWRR